MKPFQNLYLPEMLMRLKQGGGRLVRHEKDSGVIALLDSRVDEYWFKDKIYNALPDVLLIKMDEVEGFFASLNNKVKEIG
ncbi:MAG: helicase C-terminal domain-containing protein [Eubacteriales bacterium]